MVNELPPEDPLQRPLEEVISSMSVEPAAAAVLGPQSPEQTQRINNIETAMQYIAESRKRGFGAFLGSIVADEPEPLPLVEDDSLAGYDSSSTAQSLAFEVEISMEYLRSSLREAGLGMSATSFNPRLYVADGECLIAFLNGLGAASETMRSGLADAVSSAFTTIMLAHVPNMYHDAFVDYHMHPMLLPEVSAGVELADSYGKQTDQTILHGQEIAAAMRGLGVDEKSMNKLVLLHEAAREGKLGEWSVAYAWRLYDDPDTRWTPEWQQWITADEWRDLFEFMDGAAARSPHGSPFLQKLVSRLITNITNLRDGNLRYIEPPPPIAMDDDDELVFHKDPEGAAIAPEPSTYLEVGHDMLLGQVAERLCSYHF